MEMIHKKCANLRVFQGIGYPFWFIRFDDKVISNDGKCAFLWSKGEAA
jgi:hypothetical protein